MPLIYVQRFGVNVITGGTQAVSGLLQFTGPTVVELDPALFNAPGTYVLFTYGSFNAADMSNLSVDATGCKDATTGATLSASAPVNEPGNYRITVTLS